MRAKGLASPAIGIAGLLLGLQAPTLAQELGSQGGVALTGEWAGEAFDVTVSNPEPSEVTITVESQAENMEATVPMPYTTTVPARYSRLLFSFQPVDLNQKGVPRYRTWWTYGSTAVKHDENATYRLPFDASEAFQLLEGVHGFGSHVGSPNNAHYWQAPLGTVVRAAREGVVIGFTSSFGPGGTYAEAVHKINQILIRHDDGTIGWYGHLAARTVSVKQGRRIKAGTILARSGNSGYASGPQIAFEVFRPLDGRRAQGYPLRFENLPALPRTLQRVVEVLPRWLPEQTQRIPEQARTRPESAPTLKPNPFDYRPMPVRVFPIATTKPPIAAPKSRAQPFNFVWPVGLLFGAISLLVAQSGLRVAARGVLIRFSKRRDRRMSNLLYPQTWQLMPKRKRAPVERKGLQAICGLFIGHELSTGVKDTADGEADVRYRCRWCSKRLNPDTRFIPGHAAIDLARQVVLKRLTKLRAKSPSVLKQGTRRWIPGSHRSQKIAALRRDLLLKLGGDPMALDGVYLYTKQKFPKATEATIYGIAIAQIDRDRRNR